jgi:glycosyltransferase involved in cell wall biosynthesis
MIVVDALSQDRTREIAKEFTASLHERPWTGYVDQKNFAMSKASSDWVLSLDADEQISDALREEILNTVANPAAKDGYRIPRRSFYQGKWIRFSGFYPDRQLRLFRRGKGYWIGGRIHELLKIQGPVGDLKKDLFHYPYQGTLSGQILTLDRYADLYAQDMYEKGKRYRTSALLLRPLFKFLEVYFWKLGFMDGLPGVIIAATSSYGMFVRYVKLREIENRSKALPHGGG